MKSIGSVPVQLPLPAITVEPSSSVPETVGTTVLAGGSAWIAPPPPPGADVAWAEPAELVAVTETRMSWPTSSVVSV